MSIKRRVFRIYGTFFTRKYFFKLNKFLFNLSLRGIGVLNYENDFLSGEDNFLCSMLKDANDYLILDVGAHVGLYSKKIKEICPSAKVYAFEPHPVTFQKLRDKADTQGYTALNLGCSDVKGKFDLYDYQEKEASVSQGSSHASLFAGVIQDIHKSTGSNSWSVQVTTIDDFVEEYGISRIDLLKIDTEGNEYKVLLGAKKSIKEDKIDVIQFEFNEMNIVSRVFFKDIFDLLPNYSFYRLLPYGLAPLINYSPLYCEIFAYQNIVAIKQGVDLRISIYD
jgi:FkbM family methyltransferase